LQLLINYFSTISIDAYLDIEERLVLRHL